jgi:Alternative complex III, ActD subunit
MKDEGLFGISAEFRTHEELVHAAEEAYKWGFRRMDAYAPFPVEGLAEALGKKNRMPLLILLGGILGGTSAYFMMWFANVISYPINIGGRPLHSWPAFIPITFELTVLGASLTAFFFSLGLSGLPKPYHPMFNLPEFERASQDRFFLCIEADDPQFSPAHTREFLQRLSPMRIAEVMK